MFFAIFSVETVNFITIPITPPRHCIGWFSDQHTANMEGLCEARRLHVSFQGQHITVLGW